MEKQQRNTMRPSKIRALKGSCMKRTYVMLLGAALSIIPCAVLAQGAPATESTGKVVNGYTVQNSVEFGGRIVGIGGNSDMYNTMENLHSGPRLLDQSLTMRSLDHNGAFFDEFWFTSFGYGGDPQAGTRLRMYKNKLYDFNATYRTDKNYYNDNYLDNPFNTPSSLGGLIVWNQSIHATDTRRNMGDFHLTLFPESAVRFRLGYSRNINEGNALSSFHEGTELSLAEDFRSRQDQYQIGVDVKVLPRTTLSYDQFYDHNKGDSTYVNQPTGLFYINTGTASAPVYSQVDIGAIYNTYYGQPCANTPTNVVTVVNGRNVVKTGVGSSACNMYFDFHRSGPTRANFPTEKLSLISDYWKKLNIYASGDYTSAENKTNFRETADGFVGRTSERGFLFTGPGKIRQVSANADLGVTFHINEAWYISNQLKFTNWRIPGTWDMTSASCGPVGTASILSPIGTLGNPYCSQLGSTNTIATAAGTNSSFTNDAWSLLHTDKRTANTTLLGWEPGRRFGAHAGFRYATRTVAYGNFTTGTTTNLAANGTATQVASADTSNALYPETDHEQAGLFGVKLRPTDKWTINGDVELSYIDHPVAAILPGHRQTYKIRSDYRFGKWGTIAAFANDQSSRNSFFSNDFALAKINTNPVLTGTPTWVASPVAPVRHMDHNRNYGVSASLHPAEKVTFDFGWTYQDLFSTGGTCMPMTLAIVPQGGQISRCPAASSSGTAFTAEGDPYNPNTNFNGVPAILRYQQNTNTGYINLAVKPVNRVSVLLGYEITSDSGANTWLRGDTLAPFMVPVDAKGNVTYAGNTLSGAQVGYAPGPNPAAGLGPLGLNWHLPSLGAEVSITRNVAFKGMWRYYGYNEKSNPGIYIASRDFHANTGTLSLRYSF